MINHLKKKLRRSAQRLALGTLGGIMLLAGLGFFSASALMLLLTMTDPITACAILGGAFAGIGLLMIAVTQSSDNDGHHATADTSSAQKDDMPPLAAAFMQGMAQGMAVRQRAP
ncbi:phage holin family protein [Roseobacter sp. EG26]|uniref:phage holin family protein n=1 Tax=Roseobacter sp. EG26 TaxID=3412477 RepID=UPI003CE58FC1